MFALTYSCIFSYHSSPFSYAAFAATSPMALNWLIPAASISWQNLFLSCSFGIKMFEISILARLNVLLGEVHITQMSSNSFLTVAKTLCFPLKTKSPCISSLTTITPYLRHMSPSLVSSSLLNTLPVGLCGLQRKKSLILLSTIFFSKSSKSIWYLLSLPR